VEADVDVLPSSSAAMSGAVVTSNGTNLFDGCVVMTAGRNHVFVEAAVQLYLTSVH
jgi:hypothetical protein